MYIYRTFTQPGEDVFATVKWETRKSKIEGVGGEVVFEMDGVEVPAFWSQLATDVLASKYLRRAGVPDATQRVSDERIPEWLQMRRPTDGAGYGAETSARQVISRIVGCWTYWGFIKGYFADGAQTESDSYPTEEENARAFYDELCYMMLHQMAAPNSPQWFNSGLHWAYGISGEGQGMWYVDLAKATGELKDLPEVDENGMMAVPVESFNEYERPQPHACFIQSVRDNLVKPGGIMDLWTREARLFKYGSGTGTNPSTLRGAGESLSSGGVSSGLMSWLKIGNCVAGAIKSGGTTRRAAKMLNLDLDHPDVISFIRWKAREELKVAAMVEGARHLDPMRKKLAKDYGLVLDYDFNGEAYDSVDGQNANLSVRVTAEFFEGLDGDREWEFIRRTADQFNQDSVMGTMPCAEIWDEICTAAWWSGDPGLQYHTTINEWHTCAADGDIVSSNPCSEYMFLNDTACNLASLNLLEFYDPDDDENPAFDIGRFIHAVRLWTIVLDISIEMASLPSPEIAMGTYNYRTLGLGYANLGALAMQMGLPYDSEAARELCGSLTSILTGVAYNTSAELASELSPFPRYKANEEHVKRVLHNHATAADCDGMRFQAITVCPRILNGYVPEEHDEQDLVAPDVLQLIQELGDVATRQWYVVVEEVDKHGLRNAQVSLLAPCGTIGFIMDCDTTGVEPDFSMLKFKKLAGGGVLKIVNQSIEPALRKLGYSEEDIGEILEYVMEHGHMEGSSLEDRHLAVFDCANRGAGTRFIVDRAHVYMMAAAQPFLSGAISKTINLQKEATVENISYLYRLGHDLGLKAVALYRDGCKLSQPLSSSPDEEESAVVPGEAPLQFDGRHRLPETRNSVTHKFAVGNHEGYFNIGLFENGDAGELFVTMSKEGSTVSGMMDAFGIAISLCLQYGVPLEALVDKFSHQRFEPSGMTRNSDIPFAKSIVDYIFRWAGMRFLPGYREENAPHRDTITFDPPTDVQPREDTVETMSQGNALLQQDAPACDVCGSITVRSGVCYRCPNCGSQPGCS